MMDLFDVRTVIHQKDSVTCIHLNSAVKSRNLELKFHFVILLIALLIGELKASTIGTYAGWEKDAQTFRRANDSIRRLQRPNFVNKQGVYRVRNRSETNPPTPFEDVYFDGKWKLESHPSLTIPVLRSPYPTFGHVMPIPKRWSSTQNFYRIDVKHLQIVPIGEVNYILESAISRLSHTIQTRLGLSTYTFLWRHQEPYLDSLSAEYFQHRRRPIVGTAGAGELNYEHPTEQWSEEVVEKFYGMFPSSLTKSRRPTIRRVLVRVQSSGQPWPSSGMDETYILAASSRGIAILAKETWGALRALESLSQLMWCTSDRSKIFINQTFIEDAPRFVHRGVLVDTSRHYISKAVLLANLEAMAYNKLNVFHWHIVDDNSYPYQSKVFPELSAKGAFNPAQVYTAEDIKEVVEFARMRGIRVIPEFDIPGHTLSLSRSMPELLSKCEIPSTSKTSFGPLNPYNNKTYAFLKKLFTEVFGLFQDEYVHLGGDEVETVCLDLDPEVAEQREQLKITDERLMLDYFWRRVQNLVTQIGNEDPKKRRKIIVWQEAMESMLNPKDSTVAQIWKSDSSSLIDLVRPVIYSECWYLDRIVGPNDWPDAYACDPTTSNSAFKHNEEEYFLGGEACMWAEFQSDDTILQRIWPVTSAIAERLWSPASVTRYDSFGPRLEEQRCRMIERNIPSSVIFGPGFCNSPGVLTNHSINLSVQTTSMVPEWAFMYHTDGTRWSNTEWLENGGPIVYISCFILGVTFGVGLTQLCRFCGQKGLRHMPFGFFLLRPRPKIMILSSVILFSCLCFLLLYFSLFNVQ
ncbi:unnamed protein product [Calicophoron daubneyi]|uniref:beta-N-acetylhexosaminidase n=1 Tax=Calicophoron daubneyi TaxID=300641 RepID=A0AAV2T8E7_CALDB